MRGSRPESVGAQGWRGERTGRGLLERCARSPEVPASRPAPGSGPLQVAASLSRGDRIERGIPGRGGSGDPRPRRSGGAAGSGESLRRRTSGRFGRLGPVLLAAAILAACAGTVPDPDGSPEGAVPLRFASPNSAGLECKGGKGDCDDWFEVLAAKKGTLLVTVQPQGKAATSTSLDLSLIDSNQLTLLN